VVVILPGPALVLSPFALVWVSTGSDAETTFPNSIASAFGFDPAVRVMVIFPPAML
jgi:hypothetical protein